MKKFSFVTFCPQQHIIRRKKAQGGNLTAPFPIVEVLSAICYNQPKQLTEVEHER